MKKYLQMIGIVLAIIEAAVSLIKSFETPGFGEEKKNIVLVLLEAIFNGIKAKFDDLDLVWDDIVGMVSRAIDAIVMFFNSIGMFKKATEETE